MKKFHLAPVLVISLVFFSCVNLKPVEVKKVSGFRTDINPAKPAVLFDVDVYNPNTFGVTLRSMGLNLKLGEQTLADFSVAEKSRIPRRASASLPVTLYPSVADLANIAGSEISGIFGGKKKPLVISGRIVVGKFIFRKKISFREEISF